MGMGLSAQEMVKMGMYDSVYMEFECPYCHKKGKIEFQTKDLERSLSRFVPGESVGTKLDFISVTGDCHSEICQEVADKRDIIRQGSPSGFGALFNAKIRVKDGILTDEVFDIELDDESTEEYVRAHNEVWKGRYKGRRDGKAIFFR